jgi:cell division transport system permease protein
MSIVTSFRRMVRSGFLGFWRNAVVSLSAIFVMTVALFVIGATMLSSVFLQETLKNIQDKVDINVYFSPTARSEDILALRTNIEKMPQVARVEYVSRDEAIENFKKKHENDYLLQAALNELSDNPLGAVLNIQAKDPSEYEAIALFLNKEKEDRQQDGFITKVNYAQHKTIIEKLNGIVRAVERFSFVALFVLVVIAVVITFNTIRIAIYAARDEIAIMRLVGASNMFVRGPFIVQGALCGIAAAVIATALFYPITMWVQGATVEFYGGIDLFAYYLSNLPEIFIVLLISGILLGALSSLFAVRRYLKIF